LKLSLAKEGQPWELYDITADRVESRNLAAKEPEKVKELSTRYTEYAKRTQVEDWSVVNPPAKKSKE